MLIFRMGFMSKQLVEIILMVFHRNPLLIAGERYPTCN